MAWDFSAVGMTPAFAKQFQDRLIQSHWEQASRRSNGSGTGLERGVDLKSVRRALRDAQRKGDHRLYSMILATVADGIWAAEDRHRCGLRTDPLCSR